MEKAVSLAPTVADIYFDLRTAYGMLKKRTQALYAYQRVIALDPESVIAKQAAAAMKKIK